MTLSLNFRSDLIPEGRSAINRLGRTLGPRTAHGHCKERECPKEPTNPTIFAKAESGYEEQLRDLHSGVEGPPELAEVKGQCRSRTISAPTRETRYGMRSGMSELAWYSCRKYSRLNPIEPVSAKFKTLLRKARARTTRDLRRLRQNSARRMRLIPQEGRNA
jgi:hypothetical protein